MKELSIEEKAKAYDEALERAKERYENMPLYDLEYIFPELKESEGERIRKELLNYLYDVHDDDEERARWIAWLEKQNSNVDNANKEYWRGYREGKQEILDKYTELEKQGEHANFRNKIQIGDKVTRNEDGVLVNLSQLNRVAKKDEKQDKTFTKKYVDDAYLKGISDAKHELEKQGKNNMGISEATKQELEDNLNEALEKETAESWNEFLDKQGEQKPAKVESKFNVGDWIVFNGFVLHVDEIVDGYYRTTSIGGIPNSYDWAIDDAARLWTIADAKDGDVLSYENEVFIVKKSVNLNILYYCCYDGEHFIINSFYSLTIDDINNIRPATKEQRDQLEKAMVNAGYKWNKEERKLEKIEQKPTEWSEDDEETFKSLNKLLNEASYYSCTEGVDKILDWLKSLRPQNRWKPSDEQIKALEDSIEFLGCTKKVREDLKSLYEQLKKLREE